MQQADQQRHLREEAPAAYFDPRSLADSRRRSPSRRAEMSSRRIGDCRSFICGDTKMGEASSKCATRRNLLMMPSADTGHRGQVK